MADPQIVFNLSPDPGPLSGGTAVLVGGLITAAVTFGVAWYREWSQRRREKRELQRERLALCRIMLGRLSGTAGALDRVDKEKTWLAMGSAAEGIATAEQTFQLARLLPFSDFATILVGIEYASRADDRRSAAKRKSTSGALVKADREFLDTVRMRVEGALEVLMEIEEAAGTPRSIKEPEDNVTPPPAPELEDEQAPPDDQPTRKPAAPSAPST